MKEMLGAAKTRTAATLLTAGAALALAGAELPLFGPAGGAVQHQAPELTRYAHRTAKRCPLGCMPAWRGHAHRMLV